MSFHILSYLPFSQRRPVRSFRLNELRTKFQGFQKACDKSLALDIVYSIDQTKTARIKSSNSQKNSRRHVFVRKKTIRFSKSTSIISTWSGTSKNSYSKGKLILSETNITRFARVEVMILLIDGVSNKHLRFVNVFFRPSVSGFSIFKRSSITFDRQPYQANANCSV